MGEREAHLHPLQADQHTFANAIIRRNNGVVDLEDKQLERALRRGDRCEDDGWLEWEKKLAYHVWLNTKEPHLNCAVPADSSSVRRVGSEPSRW